MQNYAKYIGVGLQLAVTLLAGVFLGYFLDRKFQTLPFCTLGGSALGFLAGFYGFMRQINKKNDE
ncbi:MAG: hypothetical protein A3A86_08065 [Elusimicrobia bacterium RIFCSPLOWO2_01_FULL_60_11]|nr:MAG: hypothetical protein A3A86_08065 [Elusimicrobia bacterium RIFCSPLOWO2_01_FULL_60_11]